MEQGPEKKHKLGKKESAEIIKAAEEKGVRKDSSEEKIGNKAAEEQFGKGPERARRLKDAKNIDKYLSALFEKEEVINASNKKLREQLDILEKMYETKSRLLNFKDGKLLGLENKVDGLREKLDAYKASENYLAGNEPEKSKDVIARMEADRFKTGEELLELRKEINDLKLNMDQDARGLINLGKKVKDLLMRNKIIHSN